MDDKVLPITAGLRDAVRHFTNFHNEKRVEMDERVFTDMCDAIDSIHGRVCSELADAMPLPKDADGMPIHVGDTVTCARSVWEVTGLRLTGLAWGVCCTIFNDHGGNGTNVYPPCDLHHYHAPTVEDVLWEFIAEFNRDDTELCDGEIIERFAAKLREVMGNE